MDPTFEQKVRERAYEIWRSAGMTDGAAHEHWALAEQTVANETGKPAKAAAAKSPAKSAIKSPVKAPAKAAPKPAKAGKVKH